MEPDHVYDGHAINEYYWQWVREIEIEEGDKIRVETETTEWATPMEIIETDYNEIHFESLQGTEYMLVTYSSPHPLEPECPMIRTADVFDSKGVIDCIEVYKKSE